MLKNQELANRIFEMINTAIEASEELKLFLSHGKAAEFQDVSTGLMLMLKSIRGVADAVHQEEKGINLPAASESVMDSLKRIQQIACNETERAIHKIEFELIPLLEEMRIFFYYWGMVYPDLKKMQKYYNEDIAWLGENKYQAESSKTGQYKYDLSIAVLAYNKLDYTCLCIEGLLKNLPENLSYELIFINHGSTDGTKEYFESLHPHKQLDIAVNGGGMTAINRITEGKYVVSISNDVIVTKNAIENLYRCISSDDKIAWVVPTTPNISNHQTITGKYSSWEEMEAFAEKNNQSNPNQWEQRVRLCNPIDITRGEVNNTLFPFYHFHSRNVFAAPDDRFSLLCRRNGYKLYLAKDAFCHHFGSLTLKDDQKTYSDNAFRQGIEDFMRAFGVNPYHRSVVFSMPLFCALSYDKRGDVSILGINCGFGSNPLKIKETLKEKMSNYSVHIKNVTNNLRMREDIKSVSDEVCFADYHVIKEWDEQFDYIVFEEGTEQLDSKDILLLGEKSKKDGIVVILLDNEHMNKLKTQEKEILSGFKSMNFVKENDKTSWMLLYK